MSPNAAVERVRDLPGVHGRALAVFRSLGTDFSEVEALAALRGSLSCEPADVLGALDAMRFLRLESGHVHVSDTILSAVSPIEGRTTALMNAGVIDAATAAEDAAIRGEMLESAKAFAGAATLALKAGQLAAAVRYAAAARTRAGKALAAVRDVLQAVASAVGRVVEIQAPGMAVPTVPPPAPQRSSARPPATTSAKPPPVPRAAGASSTSESVQRPSDPDARRRAVADLLREHTERLESGSNGGEHTSTQDKRAKLLDALALATRGDLPRAVRAALLALAAARAEADAGGEAAALSLLSTIYKSLGREADARALGDRARSLPAVPPP